MSANEVHVGFHGQTDGLSGGVRRGAWALAPECPGCNCCMCRMNSPLSSPFLLFFFLCQTSPSLPLSLPSPQESSQADSLQTNKKSTKIKKTNHRVPVILGEIRIDVLCYRSLAIKTSVSGHSSLFWVKGWSVLAPNVAVVILCSHFNFTPRPKSVLRLAAGFQKVISGKISY